MSASDRRGRRGTGPRSGGAAANRRRHAFLRRRQRGLTLVELMIVVTIIAIIAAVAMAVYQDIVKKSKLAADQGVVSSLRSAVAIYYGRSNGLFPATFGAVESSVHPIPVYNCAVTPSYDPTNGQDRPSPRRSTTARKELRSASGESCPHRGKFFRPGFLTRGAGRLLDAAPIVHRPR